MRAPRTAHCLVFLTVACVSLVASEVTTIPTGNDRYWKRLFGRADPSVDCLTAVGPSCRLLPGAAALDDDTLLVFGGRLSSFLSSTTFNDVWSYTLSSGRWELLSASDCSGISTLPACRHSHSVTVMNGQLIVTGGEDLDFEVEFPDWWSFNPVTRTWTFLGDLWNQYGGGTSELQTSTNAVSAAAASKWYLYGGQILRDNTTLRYTGQDIFIERASGQVYRNHLFEYDATANTLTRLYAPSGYTHALVDWDYERGPPAGVYGGLGYYQGRVYLMPTQSVSLIDGGGGAYAYDIARLVDEVWTFTLSTSTWTKLSTTNCNDRSRPRCREGYVGVNVNPHHFYMWGGVTQLGELDYHVLNDVWSYDYTTHTWTNHTSTDVCASPGPLCRMYMGGAAFNKTMVTFGGQNFQPGAFIALKDVWAWRRAPVVTAVAGAFQHGPAEGGSVLTVTGTDFGTNPAALNVTLGGVRCGSVAFIVADTQFTCRTPAGAGTGVAVAFALREAAYWHVDPLAYFDYDPPVVYYTTSTVTGAPTSGGGVLTVTGVNFGPPTAGARVLVGGVPCSLSTYINDTSMLCSIPPGVGLDVPVAVTVGGQTSASSASAVFSYDAPVIQNVFVPSGLLPTSGGVFVTVQGINFGGANDGATVSVGGRACNNTLVYNATTLVCVASSGSGVNNSVSVTVAGQVDMAVTLLSFLPPVIEFVTPSLLAVAKANELTVIGTNFGVHADAVTVLVGGELCSGTRILIPHVSVVCSAPEVSSPQFRVLSLAVDSQQASAGVLVVSDQLAQLLGLPEGFNATANLVLEYDFDPVSQSLVNIGNALAIASLSIIALVLFLTFVNRNSRVIKSASIPFLLLTIVGAGFFAVAIFWLGSINASPRVNDECLLEYWLICIGFSLLYGSLLMKNYRILVIFMEQKMQVRFIHNQWLFVAMLVLVTIDVACLWPYSVTAHHCADPQNTGATVALAIVVVIKALLVLAGVFVSYKSRVINIAEFNERHQLAYEFYNVFAVVLFVAPATLAIETQLEVKYFLRLVALLIMSCVAILILFVPKFIEILRQKGGTGGTLTKEKSSRRMGENNNNSNTGRTGRDGAHDSDVSRNDREDSRGGGGGGGSPSPGGGSQRNLRAGGGGGGGGTVPVSEVDDDGSTASGAARTQLARSNTTASNASASARNGMASPSPTPPMRQPLRADGEDSPSSAPASPRSANSTPYSPPAPARTPSTASGVPAVPARQASTVSAGMATSASVQAAPLARAPTAKSPATLTRGPTATSPSAGVGGGKKAAVRADLRDDDDDDTETQTGGERAPVRAAAQRNHQLDPNNPAPEDEAEALSAPSSSPARATKPSSPAARTAPPARAKPRANAQRDDDDDDEDTPSSFEPAVVHKSSAAASANASAARSSSGGASSQRPTSRPVYEDEDRDGNEDDSGSSARRSKARAAEQEQDEEEEEEEQRPVSVRTGSAGGSGAASSMRGASASAKPSVARTGSTATASGGASSGVARQPSAPSARATSPSSAPRAPAPSTAAPRPPAGSAPRPPPNRVYNSNDSVPESMVDDDEEENDDVSAQNSAEQPPAYEAEDDAPPRYAGPGSELKHKPFDVAVVFGKRK